MTEKSNNSQENKAHFTCRRAARFIGAKQAVLVFSMLKAEEGPYVTSFDENNVYVEYEGRVFSVTFSANPTEPFEIVSFSDKPLS